MHSGEDVATLKYVQTIQKACTSVGILFDCYPISADVKTSRLEQLIKKLNRDQGIDGVHFCLPLPPHLNLDTIARVLAETKDVDGIGTYFIGNLATKSFQ